MEVGSGLDDCCYFVYGLSLVGWWWLCGLDGFGFCFVLLCLAGGMLVLW